MKPPLERKPQRPPSQRPPSRLLLPKLAIELGPLLIFFAGNALAGIYAGTAAFMLATLISLIAARILYHKLPVMPLVSGVIVLVFGGLTLYLHDDTFIKLKPTIVYSLFALLLAAGCCSKSRCSSCCSGRCSTSPRRDGASSACAGRPSLSPWPSSTNSSGAISRPMPGSASRRSASCRSPSCSRSRRCR